MTWLAGDVVFRSSPWAPIFSAIITTTLLILSHYSLLAFKRIGRLVRLVLLAITLYFVYDLAYNEQYTFGSLLRDTTWGTIAWNYFAKALDVGLVFDSEGKPPPQWCIPDWDKEERDLPSRERPVKVSKKLPSVKHTSVWSRTPIVSRPQWAMESNHLPVHWKLLPLPERFADRLRWSLDVCFLRRHGTSLLLPNEMRALDWSRKKLERAGKAHKETSRLSVIKIKDPEVIPFGYSETPYIDGILQLTAMYIATDYFSKLDLPNTTPGGFYGLPLHQQLFVTCSLGISISLFTDLPERLIFPVLQKWPLNLPNTSLVPMFRNVVRSKTLTEMWGYRWHTFARREFVRLGSLFRVGSHLPALTVLKTFLWSAIFHSSIFIRSQPRPRLASPITWIRPMFLPGCFALFLGQGILVLAENAIRPIILKNRLYQRLVAIPFFAILFSCLQSLYVYGTLMGMSRWVVADLFHLNLFSLEQVRSMNIQLQLHDYSAYWSDRFQDIQRLFQ